MNNFILFLSTLKKTRVQQFIDMVEGELFYFNFF